MKEIPGDSMQADLVQPRRPRRWLAISGSILIILCLTLVLAAEYVLHNAEPILRRRITETLAARFHAPVTLDDLSLSLLRGVEVAGSGLRIGYREGTAPTPSTDLAQPMIAVRHFAFRTDLLGLLHESLLHQPTHVAYARVEGLTIHIPPTHGPTEEDADRSTGSKIAILVDQFECRDVKLLLDPAQPRSTSETARKPPLEFDISTLDLQHVGAYGAMRYDAQLLNPKPAGQIRVVGHFGPWGNKRSAGDPSGQPGDTSIDGDYTFDHADLSTVKGLGGRLSSTGHFAGTVDRLVIDGHTDTPNFSLGLADHPLPLHTDFHAIVDGTDGDTTLQPVHALLGSPLAGSAFTATGKIVRVRGQGHDIQLQLEIPHGRVQDFLRLAVKTTPPLMTGALTLHAALHIPPGNTPVPEKLSLAGAFSLTGVQFTNPRWQKGINTLSARAKLPASAAFSTPSDNQIDSDQATTASPAAARSRLSANLTLNRGVLAVTDLHYSVPGALALMNGVYSTDGKLFEFKGHVRTDATVSEMVGGWKGLLLSPFDHYLQKSGAGVDLPIEISGTGGDLHFGLALDGTDDKPTAMLADVKAQTKARTRAKAELNDARGLAAQATAEDAAAAHAATLEEAQRHHNAAVRLRAEAQQEATPTSPHN